MTPFIMYVSGWSLHWTRLSHHLVSAANSAGSSCRRRNGRHSSCFFPPSSPLSLLQPTVNHLLVSCSQMTDYAVKDYNRARAYLSDLANRDKVPVFDDITEAVDEAVKFLRRDRWRSGPETASLHAALAWIESCLQTNGCNVFTSSTCDWTARVTTDKPCEIIDIIIFLSFLVLISAFLCSFYTTFFIASKNCNFCLLQDDVRISFALKFPIIISRPSLLQSDSSLN